MKLYFMIGLPTEEDEDVIGIMETGLRAKQTAQKECGVRNPNITVSVSSFVPKPHTPFQWAPMITLDEIIRKQNLLKDHAVKFGLSFRKHFSKISHLEGIVSRGDRRVAHMIYKAWSKGCRFDGWDETFEHDKWIEALEESGIEPKYMLGTIPVEGKLPWDHIDVGLEDKFLKREWIKATKNRLSPPCGKVAGMIVHHTNLEALEKTFDIDKKKLVCYHCGVACDLKEMVDERKDYLTSMSAMKDEDYVRPIRKSILDTRERRGQFVGEKYRIEFSKLGSISFISHLDLQKIMARIFKRAEIELLFSEGFKTRPLISFGPALSLGISSVSEFFDVRVPEAWTDEDNILKLLQQHSEKGIVFRSVSKLEGKATSIQDSAKSFTYYLQLKDTKKAEDALKLLNDSQEILIESYSKKRKMHLTKDIKPLISKAYRGKLDLPEETLNVIDEVSPCKGEGIFVLAKVDQGSSIRPVELVELFAKNNIEVEKPIKAEITL